MTVAPTPFTADASVSPETVALIGRFSKAQAMANATIVENQDDANRVAGDIRMLKSRRIELETQRDSVLEPVKTMIERVRGLFAPALMSIDIAEKILRGKLLAWNDAEAARVAREKREAEEAQRAARQAAEAAAAEARRVADAEAVRLAMEATIADQNGNAESAALCREAVARVRENAEAEAASHELEASAQVAVVAAPAIAKGTGGRDNWKAEPVASEADVVSELVAAIHGGRRDLLGLLTLNMPACNALARASKANFAVPGMRATNNRTTVIR